jgi:hypothetical protein
MGTSITRRPIMIGFLAALFVIFTSIGLAFAVPEVLNESDFKDMRRLQPGDILTEAEFNQRIAQTKLANERLMQRLNKSSFFAQVLDRLSTFVLWTGVPILAILLGRIFWMRRIHELIWTVSPVSILVSLALVTKISL